MSGFNFHPSPAHAQDNQGAYWSDDDLLMSEQVRALIAEQAHELSIDGVEPGRHHLDPIAAAFADEGLVIV